MIKCAIYKHFIKYYAIGHRMKSLRKLVSDFSLSLVCPLEHGLSLLGICFHAVW
jgi:hypothetical protein